MSGPMTPTHADLSRAINRQIGRSRAVVEVGAALREYAASLPPCSPEWNAVQDCIALVYPVAFREEQI